MSEWKEIRLGDLIEVKYGKDHKKIGYGAIPIYGSGGIMRTGDLSLYDQPSVLIPRKGTLSNIFYVDTPFWTVDTMFWTKINTDRVLPKFLYYSIKDYKWDSLNVGSAVPSLTVPVIEGVSINLPSLEIQKKIVDQLSEIDDKIAVNKKICENLEAQAQALFKHWFVDFAPFKDSKFVESELGLIPEGWRVGTYDDIIQDTISGDWGKEKPEGNYTHKVACIRGCDFQDVKMGLRGKTPERYILEKNYNSKHFNDKDVLVEISGGTATVSTGRICPVSQLLIDKYNGDIVCTNFCRLVRPCLGYSSYLYYSWKYKYDRKVMFGYENGTSGIKNFSIKDFTSREPLIIPRLSDLQIFEDMVEHIHTHIQNMGSESAKLATLRDTLLPKLMSGYLKIDKL